MFWDEIALGTILEYGREMFMPFTGKRTFAKFDLREVCPNLAYAGDREL